jgi:hypothetical protein
VIVVMTILCLQEEFEDKNRGWTQVLRKGEQFLLH